MPLTDSTTNQPVLSVPILSDGFKINVIVISTQTWYFTFVWRKKWRWRGGKRVSYRAVAGYNIIRFFVFDNAMNGTGCWYGSVHFLLRGAFLVEQILNSCAWMWSLTVASEMGVYLVTWFTGNSGQHWRKPLLIALHQVKIVGENKAPW